MRGTICALGAEGFSRIFKTVPDRLVVTRARDGLLLDVNPGVEASTGWQREEAIGNSALGLELWAEQAVEGANLGTWDWNPQTEVEHVNAR